MKSIRQQLTIWISSGLLLLWIGAGAGIYFSVRSGLIKAVDTQLSIDTKITRSLSKGFGDRDSAIRPVTRPPRMFLERPAYVEKDSGYYFQTWNADGETTEKSTSLGDRNLQLPSGASTEEVFQTVYSDEGVKMRMLSYRSYPEGNARTTKGNRGRKNPNVIVAIARELDEVDKTLSILLGGIAIVGLLAVIGTMLLVGISLKRGLKPLHDLGEQTSAIGADSLEARFDATGTPAELQPVYQRLNELVSRLQSSFERERRFSADLAHEIRTPIAELKMMTEVAIEWPQQASAQTHTDYHEIAMQLERMVENLLALARWESGETSVVIQAIDIEVLSAGWWQPFEEASQAKNQTVEFDFTGAQGWQTDPDLLGHIITNLLSNAVEYTPENGTIRLEGTTDELVVSNTPHGLGAEDVEHLFDRFWRQDRARNDNSHAGVGLSLAESCAQALDLDLCAEIDGQWLKFRLRNNSACSDQT